MPTPLRPDTFRRWAWRVLVVLVVAYAAWLRFLLLFDKYGPFDHPGWLVTLEHVVEAPRPWLAPATWQWAKVDQPYVGGDPINYIKMAREMHGFYQATIREPLFLEVTRFFLKYTEQDVGVSFSSLTFSVLCVLGTYLLGAAAFSRGVGLAAAVVLAIEKECASWASDGWRDETFAAFVILTAWSLLRLNQTRSWRWAVTAGVLAAAACLTRITSLTFVVPGLLWSAWPLGRATWRDHGRYAAVAAGVFMLFLAPYLINCAIKTGDPLIAVDYHTTFYLAAEHESIDVRPTAMHYAIDKFRRHPIAQIDTAVRGLVEYPFVIKWRGLLDWHVDWLGPALRALAACGLLLWIWQPTGRFLLLILFASLAPYMITWLLPGGGEWRFTMHAYAFYLIAATAAVAWLVAIARAFVADRRKALAEWRVRHVLIQAAATAALIATGWLAGYWSPYWVAREALRGGEEISLAATDNDRVFFHDGWTGLVHAGAVVAHFARAPQATLFVPLPERRAYRLVLRMDPVPDPNAGQRVRVLVNGREAAAFDLAWNPERVGAYTVDLPASEVSPGRARVEFVTDHVAPIGAAATSFPELDPSTPVAFRLWYVRVTPM
jgi:hypothetical protein